MFPISSKLRATLMRRLIFGTKCVYFDPFGGAADRQPAHVSPFHLV
jgi:hypothetical protein